MVIRRVMKQFGTLLAIMVIAQAIAGAGIRKINVQGKLTDTNGNPVQGCHIIKLRLHNSLTGGVTVYAESHGDGITNVNLSSTGVFNLMLGDGSPIESSPSLDSISFDKQYYLGISVGTDSEMSPRQTLGASGYAIGALKNFNVIGKVGINISSPQAMLHVVSTSTADTAVFIASHSVGGYGLFVSTNGSVGIGKTSPSRVLDIKGPNGTASSDAVDALNVIAGTGADGADSYGGTGANLFVGGGKKGSGSTAGTGGAITLTSGNGGTSSSGANGGAITLLTGSGGGGSSANGGNIYLTAGGTGGGGTYGNVIIAKDGGKVGIGTTSPSEKLDINGIVNISSNVKVAATKKLYLDGGSDTYMVESAANTISFYTGGTEVVAISSNVKVAATKKLYLDGGNDTYITEVSANNMEFRTAGNVAMNMDASGRVTRPLQPYFEVSKSAEQSNIAVGSNVTITFNTETKDTGNNFASNQFYAPVSGVYLFTGMVRIKGIDTAAGYYELDMNVTTDAPNRFELAIFDPTIFSADDDYYSMSFSRMMYITAGNYVSLELYQVQGTQQTDIVNGQSGTYWQGCLLQ